MKIGQMKATGLLLHTYPLFPQQWPPPSLSSPNLYLFSHIRRIFCTRSRRWDSNAETFRTQNFNFNSQENDDNDDDEDDDDTSFGENWRRRRRPWWSDDSSKDSGFGPFEELLESVWIFKAFRSFGWALPFIISSLLLATGPKAFLLALALPLGQSAVSLAFEKLLGRTQNKPKRKARTKKTPRARPASNEATKRDRTKKGKMGYQTWVPRNDISADESDQDGSSFGGWDEFDVEREFEMGSRRKSAQTVRKSSVEKGKMGRRVGKSDMPLLLRMLIAVFPFLGSWTRML